jgi:hypothetical protein
MTSFGTMESLNEAAALAYATARRDVFNMPGWTPTMVLTAEQEATLALLDEAEARVLEMRHRPLSAA